MRFAFRIFAAGGDFVDNRFSKICRFDGVGGGERMILSWIQGSNVLLKFGEAVIGNDISEDCIAGVVHPDGIKDNTSSLVDLSDVCRFVDCNIGIIYSVYRFGVESLVNYAIVGASGSDIVNYGLADINPLTVYSQ